MTRHGIKLRGRRVRVLRLLGDFPVDSYRFKQPAVFSSALKGCWSISRGRTTVGPSRSFIKSTCGAAEFRNFFLVPP